MIKIENFRPTPSPPFFFLDILPNDLKPRYFFLQKNIYICTKRVGKTHVPTRNFQRVCPPVRGFRFGDERPQVGIREKMKKKEFVSNFEGKGKGMERERKKTPPVKIPPFLHRKKARSDPEPLID